MKHSFSFYVTKLVIRLKGVKKNFGTAPINYKKIRKEDVQNTPKSIQNQFISNKFVILNSTITALHPRQKLAKVILYIHGGAFVSGPTKLHWDAVSSLLKYTSHTVWMCDYPKAPEAQIDQISSNLDAIYERALQLYDAQNIILMGDSVGGTLITSLVQRLIQHNQPTPDKIILISPVMDASFSNPAIESVEPLDLILSKSGVQHAKRLCAGDISLKNPIISPIYGSFANFPNTLWVLAEHDITYPDQQIVIEKCTQNNINQHVIIGKGMPHIWPLLPIMKEARHTMHKIIEYINEP